MLKGLFYAHRTDWKIFFSLGLLCLLMVGYRIDNDTYYLLALGKAIHADGIPVTDPLIMDGTFPVVIQQWLYALSLWDLYALFGLPGISLISLFIAQVTLFFFYKLCMLASGSNTKISIMLSVACLFVLAGMITVRPHILSAMLLTIAVYLMELYAREELPARWLLILLPLSILLINFHGAIWGMLPIVMLPYLFESFFAGRGTAKMKRWFLWMRQGRFPALLFIFFAVIACGFLNPYGIRGITYSAEAQKNVTAFHDVIIEMSPLSTNTFTGIVMLLIGFGVFSLYLRQRTYCRYFLLSFGTFILACMAQRSSLHFLLLGCFPVAYFFRNAGANVFRHGWWKDFYIAFAVFVLSICFIVSYHQKLAGLPAWVYLAGFIFAVVAYMFCCRKEKCQKAVCLLYVSSAFLFSILTGMEFLCSPEDLNQDTFPALEALQEDVGAKNNADVRLYVSNDEGPQAEFFGFKPYRDTRPEILATYDPNNRWNEWYQMEFMHSVDPLKFLEKYDFDYLILEPNDVVSLAMPYSDRYEEIFNDGFYRVYKKIVR